MFANFRRHQKWIWVVIAFVVSISMVGFFTETRALRGFLGEFLGGGAGLAQIDHGSVNGRPITDEEEMNAKREVYLGHLLSTGNWPPDDPNLERNLKQQITFRVFITLKLKELDVAVSKAAVARVTYERIRDVPYEKLEAEILAPHRLTLADFQRYIEHEAGLQQLAGAAAVSARLTNPKEAEEIYRREHEETAAQVVTFWATNYLDQVKSTPESISNYFSMHQAEYRIPERVQVAYAEFNPTNYFAEADKKLAEITNLTQSIDEEYIREGTNSFKDTNGVVLSATEAKAKIKEFQRLRFGFQEARRAAADFGTTLSKQTNPYAPDNLEKVAASIGLPTKVTPPFDYISGLENDNFPTDFKRKALSFTDEKPIEWTPITGTNTVNIYVIARKKKIPSEMPSFETIKEKVIADFRHSQALELARTAGQAFQTNLTNGLALKKPFKEICAAAKVQATSIAPFSMSSETQTNIDARLNFNAIRNYGLFTDLGQASPFVPAAEGGFIVYVESRSPVAPEKMQKEFPEFLNRLRQERQNDAFNQWFRKEAEQAKLSGPKEEAPANARPGAARPKK